MSLISGLGPRMMKIAVNFLKIQIRNLFFLLNSENIHPMQKSMPEFNFIWLLRSLSIIIPIISIITWNGSFLRSLIHDVEDEQLHEKDTNIDMQIHMANLFLLLAMRIFALFLFGMVGDGPMEKHKTIVTLRYSFLT
jgi:hypothetical protein